jgi:DNA-binding NtrC family response regulator
MSRPVRLLLVDDDPHAAKALAVALSEAPAELVLARDGQEALDELAREPVAVIVTDQFMPFLNGLDLLKIVADRWPLTRRILVSGDFGDPSVQGAVQAGLAEAVFPKPFDVPALRQAVGSALSRAGDVATPPPAPEPALPVAGPPQTPLKVWASRPHSDRERKRS